MNTIEIKINKTHVYDAVDETTAYIGAKTIGDDASYGRIATVDADRTLLENFWAEACGVVISNLKQFLVEVPDISTSHTINLANNFNIELNMPSSFNTELGDGIQSDIFNFFVLFIVGKWCRLTNKAESDIYTLDADQKLHKAMQKVYYRKPPQRKIISK